MVNKMEKPKLNEIINVDRIKMILGNYKGEKQLLELKFYLLKFRDELKEIGTDPSRLAWDIYRTEKNVLR